MEHLFDALDGLLGKAALAKRILLFLDYDGTLTPIAKRPELAVLPGKTRRILRGMAESRRMTLGIVSGRSLGEIKRLVGIDGIYYAGNHGLEAEGPGLSYLNSQAARSKPAIERLYAELAEKLRGIGGVTVEDKGYSLAVHYRRASAAGEQAAKKIFAETAGRYRAEGAVRTAENKKTLEALPPADWGKGKMLLEIIRRIGGQGKDALTIYMGDDATDEDAFRALKPEGVTVLVSASQRDSHAGYYLRSVEEVTEFLKRLTEAADG